MHGILVEFFAIIMRSYCPFASVRNAGFHGAQCLECIPNFLSTAAPHSLANGAYY